MSSHGTLLLLQQISAAGTQCLALKSKQNDKIINFIFTYVAVEVPVLTSQGQRFWTHDLSISFPQTRNFPLHCLSDYSQGPDAWSMVSANQGSASFCGSSPTWPFHVLYLSYISIILSPVLILLMIQNFQVPCFWSRSSSLTSTSDRSFANLSLANWRQRKTTLQINNHCSEQWVSLACSVASGKINERKRYTKKENSHLFPLTIFSFAYWK